MGTVSTICRAEFALGGALSKPACIAPNVCGGKDQAERFIERVNIECAKRGDPRPTSLVDCEEL